LEQQEVPMATTTIFFIKTITFLEKKLWRRRRKTTPPYSSPEGKNNDLYLGKILNTFLV